MKKQITKYFHSINLYGELILKNNWDIYIIYRQITQSSVVEDDHCACCTKETYLQDFL